MWWDAQYRLHFAVQWVCSNHLSYALQLEGESGFKLNEFVFLSGKCSLIDLCVFSWIWCIWFDTDLQNACVLTCVCVCFVLDRPRTQTCDCPCQSVTRAATPSSPWPKITRTSSCPQTCSCRGRTKVLPFPNPPSPAGGTSPTQSKLKLGVRVGGKSECDNKEQIYHCNTDSHTCLGGVAMVIGDNFI